jgi:hypothetical protein
LPGERRFRSDVCLDEVALGTAEPLGTRRGGDAEFGGHVVERRGPRDLEVTESIGGPDRITLGVGEIVPLVGVGTRTGPVWGTVADGGELAQAERRVSLPERPQFVEGGAVGEAAGLEQPVGVARMNSIWTGVS